MTAVDGATGSASDTSAAGSAVSRRGAQIGEAVAGVIEGKPEAIRLALVTLLAEGHLLIEDVPGVGKTMLAKSLARALDCTVRRIQFTPDLLPSGAVFANIVIGDEINRASPKTQSALLEAMEEHQVTVDGSTYPLATPFMVVATQNPIEMEGTYPLPEAQRDRFMARLSMGYPDRDAEMDMLSAHGAGRPLESITSVATAADVASLIDQVRDLHVGAQVHRYAVDLVVASRRHPDLRLGASPRATLQLIRAAKASAALDDRDYVIPDDVRTLAVPVLAHRLLLTAEAQIARRTSVSVVESLVDSTAIPAG